jgi:hypothetical protein
LRKYKETNINPKYLTRAVKIVFMKPLWKTAFLFFFFIAFFGSCSREKHIPDVAHIEVEVNLHRLDLAIRDVDTLNAAEDLKALEEQYPDFMEIYLTHIMNLKRPWDTTAVYYEIFNEEYLKPDGIRWLMDTTALVFNDMSKIERQFEQAFRFYRYYFPDAYLPDIYTFTSAYGVAIGLTEEKLLIGLDMFFGPDYADYYGPPVDLHRYLLHSQNRDYIVAKSMMAIIDDKLGEDPDGLQFIDFAIHEGKKHYLLGLLLPYEHDTIIIQQSREQLDWCIENEGQMWAFFVSEDLIYSTDIRQINRYVKPAPTSPGMPQESPGRTGVYIGWKIVQAYMERYPETNLQALMELPAQRILNEARFRPR